MVEDSIDVHLWVFSLLSHEGYELPDWAQIAPEVVATISSNSAVVISIISPGNNIQD